MENILITGATSGIGLATAKILGKQGYHILAAGRDPKKGCVVDQELTELGISHKMYYFDVTDEQAITQAFAEIKRDVDSLHAVVNDAGGLGGRSAFETMTTNFYRKVMALNMDSVFFVSRLALPLLKKSQGASIVNVTSIAAWSGGGPGASIYGTSKGAVVGFTRALAKELVDDQIRVNAVAPGPTDTAFNQAMKEKNPAMFETWRKAIPMKRFGQASEIANVIKFLISEDASYMTGEIVQVNGGKAFL